jgi:hypothetical protein
MSIENWMFTVVCDSVKKVQTKDTMYSCWNDEGAAKDVAMEANYITEGDNYCPKCYDDDEYLVIKLMSNGKHNISYGLNKY